MTITTTGLVIWAGLLVVIAVVVVPLATGLLRRALKASRKIEAYLADMLTAGVGVAGNTAALPALDRTRHRRGVVFSWSSSITPDLDRLGKPVLVIS